MKKLLTFFFLLILTIFSTACSTGPALKEKTSTDVSVNVASGATDVDVNSGFNIKFDVSASKSSVSSSTFFVVPVNALGASLSKSAIDKSICNPANAIPGTITPSSSGSCVTTFTLNPDSPLDYNTEYALCITSEITFCNPNVNGFFSGLMNKFTTITDSSSYTVGGTVSGLNGTVVLQNNASDDLSITSNGTFTFSTAVADGAAYEVTVKTNPTTQTCTVSNAGGTIDGANVTNVTVTCVTNPTATYSVGGTLTGLDDDNSIIIRNNETDDLSITSNGTFTFTTKIADGSNYNVDMYTRAVDQICVVTNGSGTISGSDVSTVSIACGKYHIFATEPHDGDFTTGYDNPIEGVDAYCMSQRPEGFTNNYKALFAFGDDRTACTDSNCDTDGAAEHVDWVLMLNTKYYRTDDETLIDTTNSVGLFDFDLDNTISDNSDLKFWTGLYEDFTTLDSDICDDWSSNSGDGYFGINDDVDSEVIYYDDYQGCDDDLTSLICVEQTDLTSYTYSIGGTVTGLDAGEEATLQNNGGNDKVISANGSFSFTTKLADNASYYVTSILNPAGKTCVIANKSGSVASANVTSIQVICSTNKLAYVTAGTSDGNMGGATGADTICMEDANYPGSGTYKAMIASVDRTPNLDWILLPYQAYYRTNGSTLIGITDENSIFADLLTNGFKDDPQVSVWVAFVPWEGTLSGSNCSNWSSTAGSTGATDSMLQSYGEGNSCAFTRYLICIEQ